MGLHMAVIATTLKLKVLFATSHSTVISPVITGLICPFVLKLSFRFRLVHQTYSDLIRQSRLFFFQLNQIAAAADSDAHDHQQWPATGLQRALSRLQRALRLIQQTVTQERNSQASLWDEDSIHALSMVAL